MNKNKSKQKNNTTKGFTSLILLYDIIVKSIRSYQKQLKNNSLIARTWIKSKVVVYSNRLAPNLRILIWIGLVFSAGMVSFAMFIGTSQLSQATHTNLAQEVEPQPLPTPNPTPFPSPAPLDFVTSPIITARGAIIMDVQSNTVMYAKNHRDKLMPASTTKIMTALTALDLFDPNEVVTIEDEHFAIGRSLSLQESEQYTVSELIRAIMIGSGNDGALALAQHHPQGYNGFVTHMNRLAKDLGLEDTTFSNVSGVEGEAHLTTPYDLARIAQEALNHPIITQAAATQQAVVTDITGTISIPLVNTNQLLGKVEGVIGMKTGWTMRSGECLVTLVNRDDKPLIIVVLGSQDRFGESQQLIEWAYQNFTWQDSTAIMGSGIQ